jgi:hypothetical protein
MSRSLLAPVLGIAALAIAGQAAEPVTSVTAAPASPVFAPATETSTTPARPKSISADMTARLTAAMPKFDPAKAAAENAAGAQSEARPADRPRNGIIRLPSYLVLEDKLPQIKERELLTPESKVELGLKRHPGLRFGPFSRLNNVWAGEMLEEELAIERAAEMADLVSLLPAGHAPMVLRASAPNVPTAFSGPWAGLVVPWERR